MNSFQTLSVFLFSIVLLSGLSSALDCSTPCVAETMCTEEVCDVSQGVCVEVVKSPMPVGCCGEDKDCADGNPCSLDICDSDSNSCELVFICDPPSPTPKACRDRTDCDDKNKCTVDVCEEGLCLNRLDLDSFSFPCCSSSDECPDHPCTEAYCNLLTYQCFYEREEDCKESTDSTSPSPADKAPSPSKDTPSPKHDESSSSKFTSTPGGEESPSLNTEQGEAIGYGIGIGALAGLILVTFLCVLLI
eukprot:CAMPEP_0184340084 /NCGR_PEP_ID=MMETSP1089-20130417/8745_1 /TAXON_ID=38269 ORGANISM="Gloeochaete wittrockiana, Strain SAG46.84" /NCGR_SAMPLE_ID=MMETSP1089 /ASSEMBLY_ACC=CAM_ASM_000445 /LENGTH=246 /DNA_ID=CAMNT_0026667699 /DNA_START=16 /DNA_END=753 /DNA_ORIENTATION=-